MVKHLQAKHWGWFLLSVGSSGRSEAVESTLGQELAQPLLLHPLLNITFFLLLFVSFCPSIPFFHSYPSQPLDHPHPPPPFLLWLPPCSPLSPSLFVFVTRARAHPPPLWPFVTSFSDSRIQENLFGWDCSCGLKYTHIHAESWWVEGVVCLKGGPLGSCKEGLRQEPHSPGQG